MNDLGSRKRPRNCEDEACDLMPISKRINDLHIRSGFSEANSSVPGCESGVPTHIQTETYMTDFSKESNEKIAVNSLSTRKRSRSCENETCDMMPISKRINDLNVRSEFPEADSSVPGSESGVLPHIQTNNCMSYLTEESDENGSFHNKYQPELGVVENPYYYHMNGVLFQAHVQRLQRLG